MPRPSDEGAYCQRSPDPQGSSTAGSATAGSAEMLAVQEAMSAFEMRLAKVEESRALAAEQLEARVAVLERRLLAMEPVGSFLLPAATTMTTMPSSWASQVEAETSTLRGNGEQGGDKGEEENEDDEDRLLDYTLGETLWDAPAIIGLEGLGGRELSVILLISALFNAAAQLYLVWVLMTSSSFIRRDKWAAMLLSTKRWRDNEAHQFSEVDASGTSLAARVCGLDGALSIAGKQSGMLVEINSYIGLSGRDTNNITFSAGPMLCTICIFLWSTIIAKDLRQMTTSSLALLSLPRGPTQLRDGNLVAISGIRRLGIVVLAFVRFFVAGALLYAGNMWLSHTSSSTDLILNAAALSFVMDLDELLLETTVPAVVHRFMQNLQPLRYKSPALYLEAIGPMVLVFFTVLTCIATLVYPNIYGMIEVKKAMCGGMVDFAVSQNGVGFAVAKLTRPYALVANTASAHGIKERATREIRQTTETAVASNFSFIAQDANSFSSFEALSMEDFANMGICKDKDVIDGGKRKAQKPFWFTTVSAFTAGKAGESYDPASWRCEDFFHHCDSNSLVRTICPVTCGCNNPRSGQIYNHQQAGVPKACLAEAAVSLRNGPCEDMAVANTPNWTRWWRSYHSAVLLKFPSRRGDPNYDAFIERKISGGCNDTTSDPIMKHSFCDPNAPLLFANRIMSIRAFCPATCCSDHCPGICQG